MTPKDKQRRAGRRAQAFRLYQWGPGEQQRAAGMAAWTKDNPGEPREANPYRREAVYSAEQFARAERFERWADENPDRPHDENPHRAPGDLPDHLDPGRTPKRSALAHELDDLFAKWNADPAAKAG